MTAVTGPPNPGSVEAGEPCPVHAGEGHVGDETICPDCGEDLGETVPHKPECGFA